MSFHPFKELQRRQLITVSRSTNSAEENRVSRDRTTVSSTLVDQHSKQSIFKWFLSFLPWSSAPTTTAENSKPSEVFLDTKYGLRIHVSDGETFRIDAIQILSRSALGPSSGPSTQVSHQDSPSTNAQDLEVGTADTSANGESCYQYQLFPDWHTSYLWYDQMWPSNPRDETHVDEDIIKDRYPALEPFYMEWRDLHEQYEDEHDKKRPGGRPHVFPNEEARIAWETQGFLIACWLVLQEGINGVDYSPNVTWYKIRKDNMKAEMERFLVDVKDS
jgi:hypothetical protein